MNKSALICSLTTALVMGLSVSAQADACDQGQNQYSDLKAEYENCLRTTAGKYKEKNPLCIELKEKMNQTQAQISDCKMAKAVDKAIAANIDRSKVRAKYEWQPEEQEKE